MVLHIIMLCDFSCFAKRTSFNVLCMLCCPMLNSNPTPFTREKMPTSNTFSSIENKHLKIILNICCKAKQPNLVTKITF